MLALALTLCVLAAPPRGFPGSHSLEIITQVETRLPKWLGGDRKESLATAKELEVYFGSLKAGDAKALTTAALAEQAEKLALTSCTGTQALIEFAGKRATVSFFDDAGHRCEVPLLDIGTEKAPRYVLLGGPYTDTRALQAVADAGKAISSMLVYLEKKDGWTSGSLPTPPPPDCMTVLKAAAKTVFTAEKAYFAENDKYTNSLAKAGVDLKALGVTSAKVSTTGAAPTQTFTATVGLRGGLVSIDSKGAISVAADCSP